MADDVQIPTAAVDTKGDDLLEPSKQYLLGLDLLPGGRDDKGWTAVIRADKLEMTQSAEKLVRAVTGLGAGGAVAGAVTWVQDGSDVKVGALFVAAGIVLAAGILGLARILDADVRGRSAATVAQTHARGDVACALLDLYGTVMKAGAEKALVPDQRGSGGAPAADRPSPAGSDLAAVIRFTQWLDTVRAGDDGVGVREPAPPSR